MSNPQHHMHNPEDPLPGAGSGAPATVDYSVPATESADWKDTPSQGHPHQYEELYRGREHEGQHRNPVHEERSSNVKPAHGGVSSVGGLDDLPGTKPGLGDKIVGKTQKAVGKMTKDPEMLEKGELRESGGKAAILGKAPHE